MENHILKTLINKGVHIPNPSSVLIADDVNPDRISADNVTIHTGCKISGPDTLILDNCRIGREAPVTMENVMLGSQCDIKGGYFKEAVFAGQNGFGSGGHVREGTILEEQANAAHTVGLKQTILFPFVTLGSLINFCDCFMAGGTSRKNHSEVGSSFIHFNYTPNQDKATPSMMGDVAQGVMLKSAPIFLGGQGGLVGPVRINYGCLTAAGSIIRKNELNTDRLLVGGGMKDFSLPRKPFCYKNIVPVFNNNLFYISSLIALKHWYYFIRPSFADDFLSKALIAGLQITLDVAIKERVKRFKIFIEKLGTSKKILLEQEKGRTSQLVRSHENALQKKNEVMEKLLKNFENIEIDDAGQKFVKVIEKQSKNFGYIETIQNLTAQQADQGTVWLREIQEKICKDLYI